MHQASVVTSYYTNKQQSHMLHVQISVMLAQSQTFLCIHQWRMNVHPTKCKDILQYFMSKSAHNLEHLAHTQLFLPYNVHYRVTNGHNWRFQHSASLWYAKECHKMTIIITFWHRAKFYLTCTYTCTKPPWNITVPNVNNNQSISLYYDKNMSKLVF